MGAFIQTVGMAVAETGGTPPGMGSDFVAMVPDWGPRPFDGNGWRNGRLPRKGLPETAIHRDHREMLLAGHPVRLQRVFSSLLVEILHAQRTSDTRTVLLVGVITG